MVAVEFIESTQTNDWTGPMPSGTKGSAADLAKTNLPSVSSLSSAVQEVPGYMDVTFDTLACFGFVMTKGMTDGTGDPAALYRQANAQIPAKVSALSDKKVVIRGFLLPVPNEWEPGGRIFAHAQSIHVLLWRASQSQRVDYR